MSSKLDSLLETAAEVERLRDALRHSEALAAEEARLEDVVGAAPRLQAGDEIVLSVMEHHANIVPWHFLRERQGVVLKWVDIEPDGSLDPAKVLAAVGPMQFEVVADRMDREFGAQLRLEALPYTLARRVVAPDPDVLNRIPGTEVLRRAGGEPIAVFTDKWKLGRVATHAPEVALEPIGGDLD